MKEELFEKGMQIRRDLFGAELGEKHVKEATDFTRNFQDVVTRYCFAEVWGNEDLPRRLRSIATLSMVVALGKTTEIKIHVRAALANGVTKEEIRGIMLNAMIYCGVPAAMEGIRCARETFADLGVAE